MEGFGCMEVREPDEVADVCAALSHPNRVFLYRILQEEGGVFLADLVNIASEALPKPVKYMTVKHHVHRLRDAGIVSVNKREGQFFVELQRPHLRLIEASSEAFDAATASVEIRR